MQLETKGRRSERFQKLNAARNEKQTQNIQKEVVAHLHLNRLRLRLQHCLCCARERLDGLAVERSRVETFGPEVLATADRDAHGQDRKDDSLQENGTLF